MGKRKRDRSNSSTPSAPPSTDSQPLLRKRDAVWLGAVVAFLLTAFELWSPGSAVTDHQIIGLAITLGAIAIVYRYTLNRLRSRRAK